MYWIKKSLVLDLMIDLTTLAQRSHMEMHKRDPELRNKVFVLKSSVPVIYYNMHIKELYTESLSMGEKLSLSSCKDVVVGNLIFNHEE